MTSPPALGRMRGGSPDDGCLESRGILGQRVVGNDFLFQALRQGRDLGPVLWTDFVVVEASFRGGKFPMYL
jgi:hypothetical protein